MGRIERITKELQKHDSFLYADWFRDECIGIYRRSKIYSEPQLLSEGSWIRMARPNPHFVFALTNNWTTTGYRVEWGLEPIMARIKAMDLWNRDLASELVESYRKDEESTERDGRNNMESFLYEFRDQFAKTFKDVNTSNLKKTDKRRENAY